MQSPYQELEQVFVAACYQRAIAKTEMTLRFTNHFHLQTSQVRFDNIIRAFLV